MASSELVNTKNKACNKTSPPKPTWKPGKVKVVRALYNYTAQHNTELSFNEGELLYIHDCHTDANWWKATCGNRSGLIPFNYVKEQTTEIEFPLHEAARRGNLSSLRECLKQNVSGTSLDSTGNTALYWAARSGHLDCVKELLMSVTNNVINAKNKIGDSTLHIAASRGHLEIVSLLLDNGADTSLKNNDNLSAEDLADKLSIKNLIQLNNRQLNNDNKSYEYKTSEYYDESDE